MTNTSISDNVPSPQHREGASSVFINDKEISVKDDTPTVRQLLQFAGCKPAAEFVFIHSPDEGPTNAMALDDPVCLVPGQNRFYAFKEDGIFYFLLDDVRFDWKQVLTGIELRQIGHVLQNFDVRLDQQEKKDREFRNEDHIDLETDGVERFYTVVREWVLDVQGEVIKWKHPTITVRQALEQANFDTSKPWIITLKVNGQPKQAVALDYVIDLTQPGIERLRVLKGQINNGEAPPRRHFNLLDKDNAYLDTQSVVWETITEGGRWLLLKDYPLPVGYNHGACTVAVAIPENYPAAQLDMFFCEPYLARLDGQPIPQTQVSENIDGRSFQRWSRHPTSPWQADEDFIRTHIALIDESINREVEL